MMGRWLNRFNTGAIQKTVGTPCAESAETPCCTNCTDDRARIQKMRMTQRSFANDSHNRLAYRLIGSCRTTSHLKIYSTSNADFIETLTRWLNLSKPIGAIRLGGLIEVYGNDESEKNDTIKHP